MAQVTIPTDHAAPSAVCTSRRWDIRVTRNFMLGIGPISSLYGFLTFAILLCGFHASEALFHAWWFLESYTLNFAYRIAWLLAFLTVSLL